MNRFALVLAVGVLCVAGGSAEARIWTDIYGNQTSGTYKAFNKQTGMVTITLNGRRIVAPFSGFSRQDRDYIIEQLQRDGRAADVEPFDTPIPEATQQQNPLEGIAGGRGIPPPGGPGVGAVGGPGGIGVGGPGAGIPQPPGADAFTGKGAMPGFPGGPIAGGPPPGRGFPAGGGFPGAPVPDPQFGPGHDIGRPGFPSGPVTTPPAGPGGIAAVDPAGKGYGGGFPEGGPGFSNPVTAPSAAPDFPRGPAMPSFPSALVQPPQPAVPDIPPMPAFPQMVLECDKCGYVVPEGSNVSIGDQCPNCSKSSGRSTYRGIRGIIWLVVIGVGAIGAGIKKLMGED